MIHEMLLQDINNLEDELIQIRRHLHQNPELGFDINNTVAYVKSKLEEYGCSVQKVGKNGLVSTLGNGDGDCILLRADMDALPIVEANDLSFKSVNDGLMHACGHDIHTTMLLGAAKILKKNEELIQGSVKLMFQPAEEILMGAKDMIDHGVLMDPKPDAAVMIHVASGLPITVGSLLTFVDGPIMAASDTLRIEIRGKGGHGSSPYLAIDPTVCMSSILVGLQSIQTRELVPNSLSVLTFGMIEGASTPNVIPDVITLGGTLRTYDDKERIYIKQRIDEMVSGIAKAYRCEANVITTSCCPVFKNNGLLAESIYESLQPILEQEYLIAPQKLNIPIMGSEDFAYISQEVPSALIYLSAGDSRNGEVHGVHSPNVIFNEACILNGVKAHVFTALGWLRQQKGA